MTARPTDPRSTDPQSPDSQSTGPTMRSAKLLPSAALCTGLLVLLFIPGPRAAMAFALLVGMAPACFLLLATSRLRAGLALRWAVGVAALSVGGGFALLLMLAGGDPLRLWILGLPLPAGVQIWLIGLLPLLVLGWLYAQDSTTVPSGEELRQVRDLGRDGGESDG